MGKKQKQQAATAPAPEQDKGLKRAEGAQPLSVYHTLILDHIKLFRQDYLNDKYEGKDKADLKKFLQVTEEMAQIGLDIETLGKQIMRKEKEISGDEIKALGEKLGKKEKEFYQLIDEKFDTRTLKLNLTGKATYVFLCYISSAIQNLGDRLYYSEHPTVQATFEGGVKRGLDKLKLNFLQKCAFELAVKLFVRNSDKPQYQTTAEKAEIISGYLHTCPIELFSKDLDDTPEQLADATLLSPEAAAAPQIDPASLHQVDDNTDSAVVPSDESLQPETMQSSTKIPTLLALANKVHLKELSLKIAYEQYVLKKISEEQLKLAIREYHAEPVQPMSEAEKEKIIKDAQSKAQEAFKEAEKQANEYIRIAEENAETQSKVSDDTTITNSAGLFSLFKLNFTFNVNYFNMLYQTISNFSFKKAAQSIISGIGNTIATLFSPEPESKGSIKPPIPGVSKPEKWFITRL